MTCEVHSSFHYMIHKNSFRIFEQGLAEHKDTLGAPLCPCRHYDDKAAEVGQGFWNCPCVPMRERKECHCMLFLTPDNDFAGQDQGPARWFNPTKSNNIVSYYYFEQSLGIIGKC
ncbi:ferredoxin-thioredoxin reductase catalytic chain, chloroplastic [Gossypium australe]|uniref:Ferredoxin-thioredoxin reductase catalytic chain, chloroplastic n=1 Tax=Gossypium australe TaxID=47621 RepID=A0A5B6UD35_9ROSI|nr:ferredoxin-thioredoxin reductase catalytic chain, chloroplastic [Gossypium australe]